MEWDTDPKRRMKYAVVVAVLTFGLTAATAVSLPPGAAGPGFPGALVPLIAIVGWFVLTPLVLLVGVPFGGDEEAVDERDPLEKLRDRYAAGEITEAEFDRKVERLLETDVERAPGPRASGGAADPPDLDPTGRTDHSVDGVDRAADDTDHAVDGTESAADPERDGDRERELETE